MDLFREFYAGIEGKHPENDGPIVMREELEGVSESDNSRGE
jgi:hypothetical protein